MTTPMRAVPPPARGTQPLPSATAAGSGPAAAASAPDTVAPATAPGSTRASSPDAAVASAYSVRRAKRSMRLRCIGREKRGSMLYFSVLRCGGLRSTGRRSPTRTIDFWCAVWIERRTITGTSYVSLSSKASLTKS